MLVFDAEEGPDATAANLCKTDEEGQEGAVLEFTREQGVEYPVEAEEHVSDYGGVVNTGTFVTKCIAKEGVRGVWVAQT